MATKQIKDFPTVESASSGDFLHLSRGGVDNKITVENLIPALGGFGSVIINTFNDGAEYVAGVDNAIGLTQILVSKNNAWVFFDGIYQNKSTYNVSNNLLTFNEIIPEGVSTIEVVMPVILPLGVTTSADQVQYASGVTTEDLLSQNIVFDNVNAMINTTWLIPGLKCRTLGYYVVGDNGSADYEIVPASTGISDGGTYIDLSTYQAHKISDNLPINVVQFGAIGDGSGNQSPNFQNTVNSFIDGSYASIDVPAGTYNLTPAPSYGSRSISWSFQDGAKITTSNFGFNDQSLIERSIETYSLKMNREGTEAGFYLDARMGPTSVVGPYEKDAFLSIAQTDDESDLGLHDVVGVGARGYISSSVTNGRAWGLNAFSWVRSGGDGLTVCVEANLLNTAAPVIEPETAKGKYGINVTTTTGSTAGTAAYLVGTGSGDGWYKGLWAAKFAFVNDPNSRFIELKDQFSVDRDGKLSVGTSIIEEMVHVYSAAKTTINIETDTGNEASIRFKDAGVRNWSFGLEASSGNILLTKASSVDGQTSVLEFTPTNNMLINNAQQGGGQGIIAILNATVAPTIAPTGGGILYVEAGSLKYMGSSGTITTIAPA